MHDLSTLPAAQTAANAQPAERDTILFLYHGTDSSYWSDLWSPINTVARRFPGLNWQAIALYDSEDFSKTHKELHDALGRALVLVPLISAPALDVLWEKYQSNVAFAAAFQSLAVAPILFRATPMKVRALNRKPLAQTQPGHQRDSATASIAQRLERFFIKRLHLKPARGAEEMLLATQMHLFCPPGGVGSHRATDIARKQSGRRLIGRPGVPEHAALFGHVASSGVPGRPDHPSDARTRNGQDAPGGPGIPL